MTKKEIKEKMDSLDSQIRDIQSYSNIEGYEELSARLRQMKDDYNKQIYPELQKMFAEAIQLKREYQKPVKEKLSVPLYLQKWLRDWKSGVNFGYGTPYIRWISLDEKYVIITCPGGTSGTGTAQGTGGYYYASSTHHLIRATEGANYFERGDNKTKIASHDGRLTKEKMNEWLELIKTL